MILCMTDQLKAWPQHSVQPVVQREPDWRLTLRMGQVAVYESLGTADCEGHVDG